MLILSRFHLNDLNTPKDTTKAKGPVKLIQQVKMAHSFFTVCVKSVPHYHFKLPYVVLQMAVKEVFETHF